MKDATKFAGLGASRRVHLFMSAGYLLLLFATAWGLWMRSGSGWQSIAVVGAVLLPVSLLPAILYNDRKQFDKRNAALTLPWVLMLVGIIPSMAVLSVRFEFPLRDAWFAKLDGAFGVRVSIIAAWVSSHSLLHAISDRSYDVLYVLLPAAMFLPPILGKREASESFIIANLSAFLISFPVFTLLPAIGPWAGSGFTGNDGQKAVEAAILALHSGSHTAAAVGVVCFPSFHVIWAVLSAYSLRSIFWLRIPAAVLATLVVISTVTTGWHYVVDVVAGFLVCGVSLLVARALVEPERNAFQRAWSATQHLTNASSS
jgi:hypothetical protein